MSPSKLHPIVYPAILLGILLAGGIGWSLGWSVIRQDVKPAPSAVASEVLASIAPEPFEPPAVGSDPVPAVPTKPPPTYRSLNADQVESIAMFNAEAKELSGRYERELMEFRRASKTGRRFGKVAARQVELMAQIARDRDLDVMCFLGTAQGDVRAACIKADKLWGIDGQGRVGLARMPATP